MSDEKRPGVGFFRGLLAVLRATVHAVSTLLGLFGRAVALVTRRSRRKGDTGET